QAEDGIRDDLVTGVQTCALPILTRDGRRYRDGVDIAVAEDFVETSAAAHARIALRDFAQSVRAQIADMGNREGGRFREVPNQVRSEERRVGEQRQTGWGRRQRSG